MRPIRRLYGVHQPTGMLRHNLPGDERQRGFKKIDLALLYTIQTSYRSQMISIISTKLPCLARCSPSNITERIYLYSTCKKSLSPVYEEHLLDSHSGLRLKYWQVRATLEPSGALKRVHVNKYVEEFYLVALIKCNLI